MTDNEETPSWESIARDHGRFLYNVAYRLTGNHDDAQDLVQEVLLRVRRGLATYQPTGALEGWLSRIATNAFLDEVRRRRRRPTDALPERPDRVLPASPSAEEALTKEVLPDDVCTAELAAVSRTRDLVRSLPVVDPPGVIPLRPAAAAAGPTPAAEHGTDRPSRTAPLVAAAAALVLVVLQWMPAERPVAPSLAGFGRTHASVVQAAAPQRVNEGSVRLVRAPSSLADGYQRVGVYRRGGVVHAVYSDGSHALSLFAQPGELVKKKLPDGANVVRRNGRTMHHWQRPEGDVVLWQSRGVVYTAVGDAPVEQVMTAAASMPGEDPAFSFGQRLRRGCRTLAETLSGG